MITLTAKINLLSDNNGTLETASMNLSGNNISSDLGAVVNEKKKNNNPFIIGASKVADGSTLSDGVDYFIGGYACNSNGIFSNPYRMTINDTNRSLTGFTISFDTFNRRHPKKIVVDGIEYFDNDSIFTVSNLPTQSTHTIEIDNWNTPNYPVVITGIYTGLSIEINRHNIISVGGSIFDRSDLELPSFGIISNTGEIEFNDLDGEIKDYAEQLLLQSGLDCYIFLENTIVEGAVERVCTMQTEEWNYENDSRVVSVSLKDDLEEWQEITIEPIVYNKKLGAKNFAWLYKELYKRTPQKYFMEAYEELDENTSFLLNNMYVKTPILNQSSLWTAWEKMCIACVANIYKSKEGRTKFVINGWKQYGNKNTK